MEKLMTTNVLKKFGFIRIALAACVGFPLTIATSVFAQGPTPHPEEATTERVFVTGTSIPTTETESALPLTVYSAEVLQKIGANTVAEGLRQLPSYVGNTATENDSNGGNGTAAVTLRGLGPANVLTLINTRRGFLGDQTNGYTDINAIPISAVARVEILKDGTSSVYGSDAVAGVVNFILFNGPSEVPYQGGEIYSLYGNTTDRDARVIQGYMRGGVTALDGKVSIFGSAEYYNRLDIFSRDRPVSSDANNNRLGGLNNSSPTYSGRISYRTTGISGASINVTLQDLTTVNPMGGTGTNVSGTTSYRVFDPLGAGTDPDRFNFRAFSPAIPGQEKASYYTTGRLKIFDDMLQMYGDVLYTKSKQNNGLAAAPFALGAGFSDRYNNPAEPAFSGSNDVSLSPFNPFLDPDKAAGPGVALSTDNQLRQIRYRLVNDLGPRRTLYDADYQRFTLGFDGQFNMTNNQFVSNWGYDTALVYGTYQNIRVDSGDAKQSTIIDAIVNGVDANGDGVVDYYFNPFIGQNAPVTGTANTYDGKSFTPSGTFNYDNKAAAARASYIGHSIFKERDFLYDAKANAQFFPGLYQGGIGAAIGYEHRRLASESIPDPVQVAGDQLGFNQSPLAKFVQEVDSFFGELRVPLIVSTMNLSWMRSLEFGFAYRYENFENRDQFNLSLLNGVPTNSATFNNGGNPRISVRIQPIEDVVIRGSWGKSFRSPFPFQLFQPATQNFPQLFDVVSGTFQPPNGENEIGNPGLKPETTDSYSAGVVYSPRWVRDLTGGSLTWSVDFFQVFTQNVILSAAQNAQVLLAASWTGPNSGISTDPDGPGLGQPSLGGGGPALGVTRDVDQTVIAIDSAYVNAGKRLVNGMDINTIYELPTSNWGTFRWTLGYNYFFTWKAEAGPGTGTHSFLGDYNNGTLPLAPGAIPYHKGFLRGEWLWRGFDFVMTGNYISSFNDDSAFLLAATPNQPLNPFDPQYNIYRRVTDYITMDMQLGYTFKKPVTEAVATSYAKDGKDGKDAKSAPPVGGADNGTFAQRMLWNTTIVVGVNNAFDRQPPSVLGAFNDTYDTSLYSIRDRYYYVSLRKMF
jgi:outer membrane receptor protein involved in Fe transport